MNKMLKNIIIVFILSIIYPVYVLITGTNKLLELSNACTIVGFIDIIIGMLNFLSQNGEFDFLSYGFSKQRKEQNLSFKEYRKLKEKNKTNSYLIFLIPGGIFIIISIITALIINNA